MSRSGYSEDDDDGTLGLWRGAVERAIKGKRGQQAINEIIAALDAMPEKKLAAESLINVEGEFCTLGVLGKVRGLSIDQLNPDDWDEVAKAFNIAHAMAREIVYENDEVLDDYIYENIEICGPFRPWLEHNRFTFYKVSICPDKLARNRWLHMRTWAEGQLKNHEVKP